MPIRETAARRERAREHARRDILLAAAEVFARRGYAAATLSELADAAGFAAPSLYRYFASKEQIFLSLLELVVAELDATFHEPVDRAQPLAARLELLVRAQFRLAESRRAALAVLQSPGPDAPEAGRRVGQPRAGLAYYEDRLLGWLRRNASRSELRRPIEEVARAFAGIAFAFGADGADGAGTGARRAELIVDLALNGIAARNGRRGANP
jgi:AcrR family transcriptional regulator